MLKKEISWNIALLATGTFLVFAHSFRLAWDATIIPGWQDTQTVLSPFGAVNKWTASLTIGVCFIAFRYILYDHFSHQAYRFYYVAGDDVIIVGLTDKEREQLTDKLKIQLDIP